MKLIPSILILLFLNTGCWKSKSTSRSISKSSEKEMQSISPMGLGGYDLRKLFKNFKKENQKNFLELNIFKKAQNYRFQKCAADICGQPEKNYGYSKLESNIDKDIENESLSTELEKKLKLLIDLNTKNFFRPLQLSSQLNFNEDIKYETRSILITNASRFLNSFVDAVISSEAHLELLQKNQVRFNKVLSLKPLSLGDFKRVSSDLEYANWAYELYQLKFLSDLDKIINLMNLTFEEFLKRHSVGTDRQTKILTFASEAIKFASYLETETGLPTRSLVFNSQKILKDPEKFTIDEIAFAKEIALVKMFQELTRRPELFSKIRQAPVDFKSAYENWVQSHSKETLQTIYRDKKRLDLLKNIIFETCGVGLKKTLVQSNSALNRRKFKELLDEISVLSLQLVKFRDPKLNLRFKEQFDKKSFQLPLLMGDIEKHLAEAFAFEIEAEQDYDGLTTETNNSLLLLDFYSPDFPYENLENPSEKEKIEAQNNYFISEVTPEVCSDYLNETLSDHVRTVTGASKLSWSTMRFFNTGFGIAAHETGHIVSQILEDMKAEGGVGYSSLPEKIDVWEKRACINNFHGKTTNQSIRNENIFTEEDWADYFSALIVNKAKAKKSWLKNFGCSLMSTVDNKYVTDLDVLENQSHSPEFFRLIHIEKTMNSYLKMSCRGKKISSIASCE